MKTSWTPCLTAVQAAARSSSCKHPGAVVPMCPAPRRMNGVEEGQRQMGHSTLPWSRAACPSTSCLSPACPRETGPQERPDTEGKTVDVLPRLPSLHAASTAQPTGITPPCPAENRAALSRT
ncbi:hypothetical protein HPB52_000426 [Rhipicephalus sanguineus]|uniref:Uncharacterized protein n=1 Tax=Rhipicephalus sanguineus TaxID=34632 RepID=A0A9D4QFX7_RHISA|nr:hypothetical protein HPB52_000426 [Rhipicephalus sanguineus]